MACLRYATWLGSILSDASRNWILSPADQNSSIAAVRPSASVTLFAHPAGLEVMPLQESLTRRLSYLHGDTDDREHEADLRRGGALVCSNRRDTWQKDAFRR